MKLVTQEEFDTVMAKTRGWASSHSMFSSARGVASIAAAEFYFNQLGKTIYKHMSDEATEP